MVPTIVAVMIAIQLANPAAIARETKAAAGTWAVVGMVMNGEEIPEAGYKTLRMVLTETTATALNGKDTIADGKFQIVGVIGKRVLFDLTMGAGPDKGKTFPALNEWIDNDTLKTCMAQPGQPRPSSVESEKGDRRAVFVLKRMKAK